VALKDPAILGRTLSDTERAALFCFAERIRARFGDRLRELAVFGSRARGDATETSDIDVLVVIEGADDADREAISDEATELKRSSGEYVPLAPLVLSARAREQLAAGGRRLARDVEREGISL
jgi:predicted nucleotidyltransferase